MKEKKAKASISVREFLGTFNTDEACLNHLFNVRFGQGHTCPKCERKAKWYRIQAERAYSCQWCGNHLHPTVGTPFEDSRTPLQFWFYAIYLFVTTRHGASGKELQRQLGVTYKTAYRIGIQIRKLMEQAEGLTGMLGGHVEMDEAYVGGRRSGGKRGRGAPGKAIVMGMKERGGRIAAKVIPDVKRETLRAVVHENVEPGSVVSSDELMSYGLLTDDGFVHGRVK